jgi:hypothetical protein
MHQVAENMPAMDKSLVPETGVDVPGTIMNAGYYRDGVTVMVISVSKNFLKQVPHAMGERRDFTLIFGGKRYKAGTRTTEKMAYLKICPDLAEEGGENIRLADLLSPLGLKTKDPVTLRVNGDAMELIV